MKVLVIAHLPAKPAHIQEMKEALEELVTATRQEEGCIAYTLYQSTEAKEKFMMYEKWESEEHLTQHQQTAHFKAFGKKVKDWAAGPSQVEKLPYQ